MTFPEFSRISLAFPLLVLVGALVPGQAHAQIWGQGAYWEISGGYAQVMGIKPLYGSDGASHLSSAMCFALTFAKNVSKPKRLTQFHYGIQQRITTGTSGGKTHTFSPTYLLGRVDFSGFNLGVGFAPIVFRSSGSEPPYSRLGGSMGFMAEGHFAIPVTPKFYTLFGGASQFILANGSLGPKPSLEATVSFRFFF